MGKLRSLMWWFLGRFHLQSIRSIGAIGFAVLLGNFAMGQIATPPLGTIITIAGNGQSYYGGDGGPATSASFNATKVKVDGAGNVYIDDYQSFRIRKVNAGTGTITTVAGNGTNGYSGDGGPATSAEIGYVNGVALDPSGNLYLPDYGCSCIRRVDAVTGIITTVVGNGTNGYSGDGGPATSASLSLPEALTFDSAGNIYIIDQYMKVVRKVTASTGVITTVAGNDQSGSTGDGGPATSAAIGGSIGIAVDSEENIYLALYAYNRIRRVDSSTGIITTIAGNGVSGYSGDGGPASNAELHQPNDIFINSAGDLFIADSVNNRVRVINGSTGIISTLAGNGTGGFTGDHGSATSAELNGPTGVAQGQNGTIYIADHFNSRIRAVGHAAPPATISSVSPSVAGEGDSVTISGSNFGATQGSSTVAISGITASVTSWSATSVVAVIPAGAESGSGRVAITVNGLTSIPFAIKFPIKTFAVVLSPSTSNFGQPVIANIAVGSGTSAKPTGSVVCSGAGITATPAPATLSQAATSVTFNGLPIGNDSITCTFTGTGVWGNKTSDPVVETVLAAQAGPSVSVGSSGSPTAYGDVVTFTVNVSGSSVTPTGNVSLYVDGTLFESGTLIDGSLQFQTAGLTLGSHTIYAAYAGDANYTSGNSGNITQVVTDGTGACAPQ